MISSRVVLEFFLMRRMQTERHSAERINHARRKHLTLGVIQDAERTIKSPQTSRPSWGVRPSVPVHVSSCDTNSEAAKALLQEMASILIHLRCPAGRPVWNNCDKCEKHPCANGRGCSLCWKWTRGARAKGNGKGYRGNKGKGKDKGKSKTGTGKGTIILQQHFIVALRGVESGDKRTNGPQQQVNAVSVPVLPSSPPVQSSTNSVAPFSVCALTREDL